VIYPGVGFAGQLADWVESASLACRGASEVAPALERHRRFLTSLHNRGVLTEDALEERLKALEVA